TLDLSDNPNIFAHEISPADMEKLMTGFRSLQIKSLNLSNTSLSDDIFKKILHFLHFDSMPDLEELIVSYNLLTNDVCGSLFVLLCLRNNLEAPKNNPSRLKNGLAVFHTLRGNSKPIRKIDLAGNHFLTLDGGVSAIKSLKWYVLLGIVQGVFPDFIRDIDNNNSNPPTRAVKQQPTIEQPTPAAPSINLKRTTEEDNTGGKPTKKPRKR
ncbi:MAG: hypothetical protein K2X39_07525, partial [Silvanigrellaceae bacterium]|nr:hypothetical protein [Silvanigrellaceae bacterium]